MKRSVSRSDMAQIQENFDKFCRRWGTNVWPDFSRNLTHSHYSRRHLDMRSRSSVRQDNEERVVPVCEAVLMASRGQKRMRPCENVENAIERLAASQQQWHELASVQERMRFSDRSNANSLLQSFKVALRRGMRTQLMAAQLDRDLSELQRYQEEAVASMAEAAASVLPASAAVVEVSGELSAWRGERAEAARQEGRVAQQRAQECVAVFERRRCNNERALQEAERNAVARSHPEFELFILEEKLIRDAYPPPDPRRRRLDSGGDRRTQRVKP